MSLWLITVRKLLCFSGRLKQFSTARPGTLDGSEIVASVPSLLQARRSSAIPDYSLVTVIEGRALRNEDKWVCALERPA